MTELLSVKHEAARDMDTGRIVFGFEAGEARLAGQVPTFEEYRNLVTVFQAWHGVDLPAPSVPDWLPGLEPVEGDAA